MLTLFFQCLACFGFADLIVEGCAWRRSRCSEVTEAERESELISPCICSCLHLPQTLDQDCSSCPLTSPLIETLPGTSSERRQMDRSEDSSRLILRSNAQMPDMRVSKRGGIAGEVSIGRSMAATLCGECLYSTPRVEPSLGFMCDCINTSVVPEEEEDPCRPCPAEADPSCPLAAEGHRDPCLRNQSQTPA